MKKISILLLLFALTGCGKKLTAIEKPEQYILQMFQNYGSVVEQGIDKAVVIPNLGERKEMRIDDGNHLIYTNIYQLNEHYNKEQLFQEIQDDIDVLDYVMNIKQLPIHFQQTDCVKNSNICYVVSVMGKSKA